MLRPGMDPGYGPNGPPAEVQPAPGPYAAELERIAQMNRAGSRATVLPPQLPIEGGVGQPILEPGPPVQVPTSPSLSAFVAIDLLHGWVVGDNGQTFQVPAEAMAQVRRWAFEAARAAEAKRWAEMEQAMDLPAPPTPPSPAP